MVDRSQVSKPTRNGTDEPGDDKAPLRSTTFLPSSITRPDDLLLIYYIIISTLTLFLFPFFFLPLYFKYKTLEYEFDETGISMKWGILFRREVNLTYRRIQDIHVTRDIVQRWLGLSTLSVQTASGSAKPEMSIVGIKNPDIIRDYLYRKMRGVDDNANTNPENTNSSPTQHQPSDETQDEALQLLIEIRDAICRLADTTIHNDNNQHNENEHNDSQSSEQSS